HPVWSRLGTFGEYRVRQGPFVAFQVSDGCMAEGKLNHWGSGGGHGSGIGFRIQATGARIFAVVLGLNRGRLSCCLLRRACWQQNNLLTVLLNATLSQYHGRISCLRKEDKQIGPHRPPRPARIGALRWTASLSGGDLVARSATGLCQLGF